MEEATVATRAVIMEQGATGTKTLAGRTIRVLIADDNDTIVALVRECLEPYFHVVASVSDGRALVREAVRLMPDVLVTDITMPMMSGIEAARRLKKAHFPAKVIFLTIHNEPDFIESALAAGALGYVSKSSADKDLVPAIEAAILGKQFISKSLTA